MSLRVVLFTRSSRPSGAQMAWRLLQSGYSNLIVIVEKRGKMFKRKMIPAFAGMTSRHAEMTSTDAGMISRHAGMTYEIVSRLSLVRKLGIGFVWSRLWEYFQIRKNFYLRKWLKERFKSPVYLSIEELALDHPVRLIEVDVDHAGIFPKPFVRRFIPVEYPS